MIQHGTAPRAYSVSAIGDNDYSGTEYRKDAFPVMLIGASSVPLLLKVCCGRIAIPYKRSPGGAAIVAPMYRPAVAEEIAQTILFVASDKARYLTGESISIDGGYTTQ